MSKRLSKKIAKSEPDAPSRDDLLEQIERMRTMLRHALRETNQLYADLDPILKREPAFLSRHKNTTTAQRIIEIAENEWLADIRDDASGSPRIDEYIRGDYGLNWGSADVRDLSKPRRYQPGTFAWCGAFAAYCYGLGAELNARIRKYTMPSCSRLWRDWGGTARMMGGNDPDKGLPPFYPMPGDIVTVQNPGSIMRDQGSHIVLCVAVDADNSTFSTIEGNAWGYFPDGTRGEGVTRNERDVSTIAKIYRPVETDFDQ